MADAKKEEKKPDAPSGGGSILGELIGGFFSHIVVTWLVLSMHDPIIFCAYVYFRYMT